MRKAVLTLAGIALLNASAFAGTIGFSNDGISVNRGEAVVMDISVTSSDFAQFDTVSLLLGSNAALDWTVEYDAAFEASTSLPVTAPGPFFVFPTDSNFGGNNFGLWSAPLLVARVTIDTSALNENETYELFVSSAAETNMIGSSLSGLGSGFEPLENVEGIASFTVVPEPATLALLGIGGMAAAIRRRRTA